MFLVTFTTIFLAGRIKVGKLKVIKRFAYATILCILTFCICVLPFASNNDPKWKRAIDRVNSVIIGCVIGAIGSFVFSLGKKVDRMAEEAWDFAPGKIFQWETSEVNPKPKSI